METRKLKSKEIKVLLETFKKYGINESYNFGFLRNRNKVYVVSKEIYHTLPSKLYKRETGLFIGFFDDSEFIFTIEGAQIFGKYSKNVLDLEEKELYYWLHGQNFQKEVEEGYYLLKFGDDIVGWAKVRNKTIMNNVDKERVIFRL